MGRLPLKCLFPLSLVPAMQRDASPPGNTTVYNLTIFYFTHSTLDPFPNPHYATTTTTSYHLRNPYSATNINNHIRSSTLPALQFDQGPTVSRMAHMQWPVGEDAISFGDAITLNLLYPSRRNPPAVEPLESASLCSADPGAAAVLRWIPPDEMDGWTWEDGAREIEAYDWGWQVGDPPREEEVEKKESFRERVKHDGGKEGEGEGEGEMEGVEFAHVRDRVAVNASAEPQTAEPVQEEGDNVKGEEYGENMQADNNPEDRIQQQDGNRPYGSSPALSLLIPKPIVDTPDSTISPFEFPKGNTCNGLETIGEHGAEEGSQFTREVSPYSSAGPAILPSPRRTQRQGSELVEASPRAERHHNAEVAQYEGGLRVTECNEGHGGGSMSYMEGGTSDTDDCHEGGGDEPEHFATDDWEAEPLQSKTINDEQVVNLAGQFTTSLFITNETALSHHMRPADHTKSIPVEEKDDQQTELRDQSTAALPPITSSSSAVAHTVGSTSALSVQAAAPIGLSNGQEDPSYPNPAIRPTIEAQYGDEKNNYPDHFIPLAPPASPRPSSLHEDRQTPDDHDDDEDDANFHGVDPDYTGTSEVPEIAITVPRVGEGDGVSSHSQADLAGAGHVDTMQQPLLSGLEEAAARALLQLGSPRNYHAGGVVDYGNVERNMLPDIRDILSAYPHESSDASTNTGMSTLTNIKYGLENAPAFNSGEINQDNRHGLEGTPRPGGGHPNTTSPNNPYAVTAKQPPHPAPAIATPIIKHSHATSSRNVACAECRRRKAKCVRDPRQLDVACERCSRSNKTCIIRAVGPISAAPLDYLSTRSKSEGPQSSRSASLPADADLRGAFPTHEAFDQKTSQQTAQPFLSLGPMGADTAQSYQFDVTYVPVHRGGYPSHQPVTPKPGSLCADVNLNTSQNSTPSRGPTPLIVPHENSDSVHDMPEESAIQDMLASNISSPSEETAAAPPSTFVNDQSISRSEQQTLHEGEDNPSTQLLPKTELEIQHAPERAEKDMESPFPSTPTPTQFFQPTADVTLQQSKTENDRNGKTLSVGATGGTKRDNLTDAMSDLSDVPPTLESPTKMPLIDSDKEEECRTLGAAMEEAEKKDDHTMLGADIAQQSPTQDISTQIAPTLTTNPKPKKAGPKPRSKLPLKRNRSLSTRVKNPSSSKRKDKDYKPGSSGDENDEPAKKKQKKRRSSVTGGMKAKGNALPKKGRGSLDRADKNEWQDVRVGAEEEARDGGHVDEEEQREGTDGSQDEGAKDDNNKQGNPDDHLPNVKDGIISLDTTVPAPIFSAVQGEQLSRPHGRFPNAATKSRTTDPSSVRRESLRNSTLAQAPEARLSALVPKPATPSGAQARENAEADGKANATPRTRSLTPTDLQPRYGKRTTRADTLREKQAGSDEAATVAMRPLDTEVMRKGKRATQAESGTGRGKVAGNPKRKVEEEVSTFTDMKSPPCKRASRRVSEKVEKEKEKARTGVSTRKGEGGRK